MQYIFIAPIVYLKMHMGTWRWILCSCHFVIHPVQY